MADLEQRVSTLEKAAAQNVKNVQSLIDQAIKQRSADVKQIAENISKNAADLKALDARVSTLEKAAVQNVKNVESLIDQAIKQREADVKQIAENNKKISQLIEGNQKRTELVDKKLENLKGVMDDMEKRHVKLVATSIENYDKLIRKSIKSECATAVKKKK